jgi:hypothetical protein
MKTTLLLRIASVLVFLHAALHLVADSSAPEPGPELIAASAMKSNPFHVMGVTRTFWDFYRGFSLFGTILLIAAGFVLWQLGTLAKKDAAALRPIIATFAFAFLATSLCAYKFLVPPPAIMELVIAAILGVAAIGARKVA